MANGGPRILPPLQQQPGALEQFLSQFQQNLPQGLQQLQQLQRSTQVGTELSGMGSSFQDPIEGLIERSQNAQQQGASGTMQQEPQGQQDTSQEMMQTLQQLGVQPAQQTPQEMLGSMLQQGGMQQGRDLQGMLQALQGGQQGIEPGQGGQQGIEPGQVRPPTPDQQPGILERTPSQSPNQEAAETYQDLQQKPEPQREEQPSPLDAQMHPVHTPEQLRYLQQNVLYGSTGRQLQEAQQRRDQLEALRGKVDDEKLDKAISQADKRINNLQARQSAIDTQHQGYIQRVNQQYEGAMDIADSIQELRASDEDIQSGQNTEWWRRLGSSIFNRGGGYLQKIGQAVATGLGMKLGGPLGSGIGALLSASFNLDMLQDPDIGEAEQFQSQLKRGMRQVYGKDIGDNVIEDTFGKMSLVMQTPELRQRFYGHLQKVAQANALEKKYADEVLEANNDYTPANIENYVKRMTSDKKRKLYQEFQQLRRDIIKQEKQQQGKQTQAQRQGKQTQAQREDAQLDQLLERA